MLNKISHYLKILIHEERTVLNYLKARYPLFHKSNVFFRDIQFGIKHYLENREIKLTYTESEILAQEFIKYLESKGILRRINDQIFLLNYPEFAAQSKSTTKI
ncbi:MAG: hypothetical protein NUV92_11250 [Ignavibacteria bacterium]|jgi:hypothetical protein|nr:hypothetical protein [Ignavibacteria bacterium]MDH7528394.1 hypothetical protein [Ignavibacteria bacterium]